MDSNWASGRTLNLSPNEETNILLGSACWDPQDLVFQFAYCYHKDADPFVLPARMTIKTKTSHLFIVTDVCSPSPSSEFGLDVLGGFRSWRLKKIPQTANLSLMFETDTHRSCIPCMFHTISHIDGFIVDSVSGKITWAVLSCENKDLLYLFDPLLLQPPDFQCSSEMDVALHHSVYLDPNSLISFPPAVLLEFKCTTWMRELLGLKAQTKQGLNI